MYYIFFEITTLCQPNVYVGHGTNRDSSPQDLYTMTLKVSSTSILLKAIAPEQKVAL